MNRREAGRGRVVGALQAATSIPEKETKDCHAFVTPELLTMHASLYNPAPTGGQPHTLLVVKSRLPYSHDELA